MCRKNTQQLKILDSVTCCAFDEYNHMNVFKRNSVLLRFDEVMVGRTERKNIMCVTLEKKLNARVCGGGNRTHGISKSPDSNKRRLSTKVSV